MLVISHDIGTNPTVKKFQTLILKFVKSYKLASISAKSGPNMLKTSNFS